MTTQRLKILQRFWLFNIGYNWYCRAHEGEHGTNKKANSGFVSEEEAETKALNSEKKAIDDLKKLNNKASR